jgi:hypothetical protein
MGTSFQQFVAWKARRYPTPLNGEHSVALDPSRNVAWKERLSNRFGWDERWNLEIVIWSGQPRSGDGDSSGRLEVEVALLLDVVSRCDSPFHQVVVAHLSLAVRIPCVEAFDMPERLLKNKRDGSQGLEEVVHREAEVIDPGICIQSPVPQLVRLLESAPSWPSSLLHVPSPPDVVETVRVYLPANESRRRVHRHHPSGTRTNRHGKKWDYSGPHHQPTAWDASSRAAEAYDDPVNRVLGGNKQQGYDDTARAC